MSSEEERREAALERLEAKRDFRSHLMAYVIVNAMLIVIWAVSDAGGYFWPIWPIVGWGVGLAFNAWAVYVREPITEDDIREEMRRDAPSRPGGP